MKRALCIVVLAALAAAGATAQISLAPLNDDFGVLMKSVGEDIAPQLLHTALAGDIVGEAAFKGKGAVGNITVTALGAGFGNGIASALNDESRDWKFTLSMPSLLKQALGSDTMYDASRNLFPYPALAMGIGISPIKDYEILINGFYLPGALVDTASGLSSTVKKLKPTVSAQSVVVKVRKVLFKDEGGFPAMSVALGGAYSRFTMGASIASLTDFGDKVDVGGGSMLDLSGSFDLDTSVYGGGLEFHLSKRLPLITPFAKVGLWYRTGEVSSNTDLVATLTPTVGSPTTQAIVAKPEALDTAVSAIAAAGFELRLFAVTIHLSGSLDLDRPLVEVRSLKATGVSLNDFAFRTGVRLAF